MIQYILECIIFQLVFLIIYDLWLKKETFFQWNRFYLIGTYALSLVLPWMKIEALATQVPERYVVVPQFLTALDGVPVEAALPEDTTFHLTWQEGILFGGMLLAVLLFVYKVYQIHGLRKGGAVRYFKDYTRIIVADSHLAFSFFRSIFLGDRIGPEAYPRIIQHELVHIKQGHTWDLMFFELMRVVGWFNPLVYVYQRRISELHEFIADAQVAKIHKREQYQFLLSQVFQTRHISFINPFFKSSLIKKRIVMLQKTKSKRIFQLKYLLLVPFVIGMLCYTSCEQERGSIDTELLELSVADVQNLSEEEEKTLLVNLYSLSEKETDWSFLLKDANTHITFGKAVEGSFISGPNGELISAKMVISSKVLDENFSLFDRQAQKLSEFIDGDTVPFGVIDEVPIFPGCENESDQRACFQQMIQQHISKNFRYPLEAQKQGIQGRVSVLFVIAKDGNIQGLKARGPHKLLEDEVIRIISRLPKMTPGKGDGKVVNVPFSIPVTFKLDNAGFNTVGEIKEYEKIRARQLAEMSEDLKMAFENSVPFAEVSQVPVFPGCEEAGDGRACFAEKMRSHIMKHFNYPQEAQEQGIQGRVSIMFLISSEGQITNIAKRGPDPLLENEAVRIISKLPTMKPGKNANGEVVNVPFSIPISFRLKS